jgi:SulP family sulfate permease
MQQLVLPALMITLVSFLETASSAKVDNERAGRPWDQNQDLIGQGLGKIASAVCGAFPTSSSFSRSALNLCAGARTGWATIASAGVVLVCLLIGMQWMQPVPQSVLAAIVIVAVMGLLRPAQFIRLWRVSRVEAVLALLTFAVTIWTAPHLYWGVLAGVLSGLIHFLYQRLHPRIVEIGLHPDGSLRDRHLWKLPALAQHLYALRMDDELDFASATALERAIVSHLAQHSDVRHVCLFAQPINRIDATGVEVFGGLRARLTAQAITLHISGLKLPVEQVLHRAGALAPCEWLRLYRTESEALAALSALATTAYSPQPGTLTIRPSSG